MTDQCVLCHGGTLSEGTTTETFTRGDQVIVIKDVPARICSQCGEAYTSSEVTAEVLREARQALSEGLEVAVRRYQAPAEAA